jgi:hypothetical protein
MKIKCDLYVWPVRTRDQLSGEIKIWKVGIENMLIKLVRSFWPKYGS